MHESKGFVEIHASGSNQNPAKRKKSQVSTYVDPATGNITGTDQSNPLERKRTFRTVSNWVYP